MRWHDDQRALLAAAILFLLTACSGGTGPADNGETTEQRRSDGSSVGGASQTGIDADASAATGSGSETARAGAVGSSGAGNGFVVIRSTGPSAATLTNGRRFTGDDVVTLVAGDRLVVTDGQDTRTLSGPGRFDLGTPVPATGNAIDTARDYAVAVGEGRGRSEVGGTRRTAAPPGSGGPRQPPPLANGATLQVQLPPTATITPRPPRPRIDAPRVDVPRLVRPRIDPLAPRVDNNSIAAAPPAPDAPVAARIQPPTVAVRRAPQQALQPPQQP
jgi:hypothetical protein